MLVAVARQSSDASVMRYQGRITSWNDDQGFGFISPNGGGARVFVHITSFSGRGRRPAGNEIVTYEVSRNDKGQLRADNVAFVGARKGLRQSSQGGAAALAVAGVFLAFLAGSAFAGSVPPAVPTFYLAASVVAYVAYAVDKAAARSGRWRTRESTLHLLGIVGGWPGALVAQRIRRHKSRKPSFQLTFWATVLVNCGALWWLLSPAGVSARAALSSGF